MGGGKVFSQTNHFILSSQIHHPPMSPDPRNNRRLHTRLVKKEKAATFLPAVQVNRSKKEPSLYSGGESRAHVRAGRLRRSPGSGGCGRRAAMSCASDASAQRPSSGSHKCPTGQAAALHPYSHSQTVSRCEVGFKTATVHVRDPKKKKKAPKVSGDGAR